MASIKYGTVVARTMLGFAIALTFVVSVACKGYVFSEDTEATREAEKIAEKVKRKVERSEKAEGSQDLVKDKVTVKTGDNGQPVIEQHGEASFYGPRFHGKKTATVEKFDQNDLTAAHPAFHQVRRQADQPIMAASARLAKRTIGVISTFKTIGRVLLDHSTASSSRKEINQVKEGRLGTLKIEL